MLQWIFFLLPSLTKLHFPATFVLNIDVHAFRTSYLKKYKNWWFVNFLSTFSHFLSYSASLNMDFFYNRCKVKGISRPAERYSLTHTFVES